MSCLEHLKGIEEKEVLNFIEPGMLFVISGRTMDVGLQMATTLSNHHGKYSNLLSAHPAPANWICRFVTRSPHASSTTLQPSTTLKPSLLLKPHPYVRCCTGTKSQRIIRALNCCFADLTF